MTGNVLALPLGRGNATRLGEVPGAEQGPKPVELREGGMVAGPKVVDRLMGLRCTECRKLVTHQKCWWCGDDCFVAQPAKESRHEAFYHCDE